MLGIWAGYSNCAGLTSQGIGGKGQGFETVLGNPYSQDNIAALPQTLLNSEYPKLPEDSKTLSVGFGKPFSNCQAALDAANPGDVISVDSKFVCSSIVLRNKKNPHGYYTVIQSANLVALPQQGNRISSADFTNLAIIEATNGPGIS